MKKIITFVIAIAIPLLVGGISAYLTSHAMAVYKDMAKPPLSPPAWVFPVAWTILYILMGLASYLVFTSSADTKSKFIALLVYAVQLFFNFFWSIIFFNKGAYLTAFLWIILLWGIVIFCINRFFIVSIPAGYLMIPYVVWLTFAAYLNLGTVVINMRG